MKLGMFVDKDKNIMSSRLGWMGLGETWDSGMSFTIPSNPNHESLIPVGVFGKVGQCVWSWEGMKVRFGCSGKGILGPLLPKAESCVGWQQTQSLKDPRISWWNNINSDPNFGCLSASQQASVLRDKIIWGWCCLGGSKSCKERSCFSLWNKNISKIKLLPSLSACKHLLLWEQELQASLSWILLPLFISVCWSFSHTRGLQRVWNAFFFSSVFFMGEAAKTLDYPECLVSFRAALWWVLHHCFYSLPQKTPCFGDSGAESSAVTPRLSPQTHPWGYYNWLSSWGCGPPQKKEGHDVVIKELRSWRVLFCPWV